MRRRVDLTPEQWEAVVEALPAAHALARAVARRCANHTVEELETLAEDSLMRRVRRFDPAWGSKLIDFARAHVRLDLLRAARARAQDRCVAAGLRAMDRHEEAIEPVEVASRFAESLAEKEARARAAGEGLMDAAYYAYEASGTAPTPEEDVAAREDWDVLRKRADEAAEHAGLLLELVYEQDMPWKDAAKKLGMSVRQAQRVEARALAWLRSSHAARQRR